MFRYWTKQGFSKDKLEKLVVETFNDLLARSDHLVVAASATPATRHLIGREALEQVKPGVHLVNIARGELVDQDALREALDDVVRRGVPREALAAAD